MALDTHRYVKRLKSVGFTEEQAEAQAEAFSDALTEHLVTKADLLATKTDLEKAIADLRIEFRDAQATLIRWLIPMMIGQTAIVAALVKLL